MTHIEVDYAIVLKALEDLDINAPVYQAYIDDDTLVIKTREGTHTLPVPTGQPAVLDEGENCQAERSSAGLDDFTAIDGVGPVTAQKFHDAGLYTYDDLRDWLDQLSQGKQLEPELTSRQIVQVSGWLAQRLV